MRALTLFRSLHSLRHGHRLTQMLPLCRVTEIRNFSHTSRPLCSILKLRDPVKAASYQPPASVKYLSSIQPCPTEDDVQINNTVLSLKTVEKQLEFFEIVKDSVSIVDKVTILQRIAKILMTDEKQRKVLKQQKVKPVKSSMYLTLLDSISEDISKCQPSDLANVFYALGKIQEKDHELVRVCEIAILSHDLLAFSNINMSKIVNGCVSLNLSTTGISSKLQESICNGQMKTYDFHNRLLSEMLMLYAKSEDGTVELFQIFLEEILSRDFSQMSSSNLSQIVWSFTKRGVKADKLFDRVEEEILRRGTTDLKRRTLIQLPWAFSKSKKGSQQFFNFLENEIVARGHEEFNNAELLDVAWSFASSNMTNSKVFDLIKEKVFKRGVQAFKTNQLIVILMSFVSAQRHDKKLMKEIEKELLSRDVKQFDNAHLCQIVCFLGKTRKYGKRLCSVIEEEVFQRGLDQFSKKQKFMLLGGYIQSGTGSTQLYEQLQSSFLASNLAELNSGDISDLAWWFSKTGIKTGPLFDALEKEILKKGKNYFNEKQLSSIKDSFRKVGKGTKELLKL